MFCPECEMEYESDSLECPECGAEMVAESDEGQEEESEFIPLVETTEVLYFSLVTTSLEEAGVPWFVQSEPSPGGLPRDGGAAGERGTPVAVIYVEESRLERARALVEKVAVGAVSDD